jgi:hypothetical protein
MVPTSSAYSTNLSSIQRNEEVDQVEKSLNEDYIKSRSHQAPMKTFKLQINQIEDIQAADIKFGDIKVASIQNPRNGIIQVCCFNLLI